MNLCSPEYLPGLEPRETRGTRHYAFREMGLVEIESEWTGRDRELKVTGGQARVFFVRVRPRPRACPEPALSLPKGLASKRWTRTWGTRHRFLAAHARVRINHDPCSPKFLSPTAQG